MCSKYVIQVYMLSALSIRFPQWVMLRERAVGTDSNGPCSVVNAYADDNKGKKAVGKKFPNDNVQW